MHVSLWLLVAATVDCAHKCEVQATQLDLLTNAFFARVFACACACAFVANNNNNDSNNRNDRKEIENDNDGKKLMI